MEWKLPIIRNVTVDLAFCVTVSSIFKNVINDILIEHDQSEEKYLHVYRRFVKKNVLFVILYHMYEYIPVIAS